MRTAVVQVKDVVVGLRVFLRKPDRKPEDAAFLHRFIQSYRAEMANVSLVDGKEVILTIFVEGQKAVETRTYSIEPSMGRKLLTLFAYLNEVKQRMDLIHESGVECCETTNGFGFKVVAAHSSWFVNELREKMGAVRC